jgi:hypothetical protein
MVRALVNDQIFFEAIMDRLVTGKQMVALLRILAGHYIDVFLT